MVLSLDFFHRSFTTYFARRDKKKSRLTGALCGLGYDPESKGAVLPDHDIEVTFDTVITNKDIATVSPISLSTE